MIDTATGSGSTQRRGPAHDPGLHGQARHHGRRALRARPRSPHRHHRRWRARTASSSCCAAAATPPSTGRAGSGAASRAPVRLLATARARHARSRIRDYDASLYAGPAQHPIGPNDNIAPVSALMMDEGAARTIPATDPHRAARTRRATWPVPSRCCSPTGPSARRTIPAPAPGPPRHSQPVARTRSPPLSAPRRADADQQRQRHRRGPGPADRAAPPAGRPSFGGAGQAVKAQLRKLGAAAGGRRLHRRQRPRPAGRQAAGGCWPP